MALARLTLFRSAALARGLRTSAAARGFALEKFEDTNPIANLSDSELLDLIRDRKLSAHKLESVLGDCTRAVRVRREVVTSRLPASAPDQPLARLPVGNEFDADAFYDSIEGANCENVIGYLPVPVGVAGPLVLDGQEFQVPLATTEGALVASTNRGCRAIALAGGASSVITSNGMTRAPLLRCRSAAEAAAIKAWVELPHNAAIIADAFNSTTRFGRLRQVSALVAGRNVYVRFASNCGDAMGMNMVTKGSFKALETILAEFPGARLASMSGNACADKKPSAVNWVNGRGRSVSCEVVLPRAVVENVLHTTVDAMIELNVSKNLVGSAISGSLGGFNAHSSNLVSALFLATGNDIAQNVESSSCITLMEREGEDLHLSVTMPSIEVGTVGGGTSLPGQHACLQLLGCAGANRQHTGANADTLARVVAGTVMAGELSLMAALASNDLLKAHMDLNRKKTDDSSAQQHQHSSGSGSGSHQQQQRNMSTSGPKQRQSYSTYAVGISSAVDRINGARYRAGFYPKVAASANNSISPASPDFGPRLPVP